MTLTNIRIFISSPGDVQEERDIARGVIQQLGRSFAARLQLQPVLWEELALGAEKSVQKGIDLKLSELNLDIAVFILWSRLGSATEPLIFGDQVKPFRSGTEREWYLMLQAREDCVKRGVSARPDILTEMFRNLTGLAIDSGAIPHANIFIYWFIVDGISVCDFFVYNLGKRQSQANFATETYLQSSERWPITY